MVVTAGSRRTSAIISSFKGHIRKGRARKDNDLFVNLFIASTLNWEEKNLQLVQQTSFPDNESTVLTIKTKKRQTFTLNIRYPEWVEKGKLQIKINGRLQKKYCFCQWICGASP